MDTRFFDVLHHTTDVETLTVIEGIDVDFYGVVQKVVYQKRVALIDQCVLSNPVEVTLKAFLVIDDFHASSAKNK